MSAKTVVLAIEGIDSVGKNSIARALKDTLEQVYDKSVKLISFPRYETTSGKVIKEYLSGMFFDPTKLDPILGAAPYTLNRLEYFKENPIEDEPYDFLILDRGYYSNFIHQASKYNVDDPNEIKQLAAWMLVQYRAEIEQTKLNNYFGLNFYVRLSEEDRQKQEAARIASGREADLHEANKAYLDRCRNFIENSRKPKFMKDIYDALNEIGCTGELSSAIRHYYLFRSEFINAHYVERPKDCDDELYQMYIDAACDDTAEEIIKICNN